MRVLKAIPATALLLGTMTGQGLADPSCTTPVEMAALRTAAVQQQLMVAGLICHDVDSYNRFVIGYRPELQKADADLKDYFVRRGGERGESDYDTFKTKLANLSSLSDIADNTGYCANAAAAFALAAGSHQSLASFVADQRLMIALPKQAACVDDKPVLTEIADAKPQLLKVAAKAADDVSVAGVPAHDLPAAPFGEPQQTDRSSPPPARPIFSNDNAQDESLPPPLPRSPIIEARERAYAERWRSRRYAENRHEDRYPDPRDAQSEGY